MLVDGTGDRRHFSPRHSASYSAFRWTGAPACAVMGFPLLVRSIRDCRYDAVDPPELEDAPAHSARNACGSSWTIQPLPLSPAAASSSA